MYPVNYHNNWTIYIYFNFLLTILVEKEFSCKNGVGSFVWSIYLDHVMLAVPSWKILNTPPCSNVINEIGFYYGMWCLLPKEWWNNQVSGLFYYNFFLLPFMCWYYGGYFTVVLLLIFLALYRNKNMIYYLICLLFGINCGWCVCGWNFYYCVSIPVLVTSMKHH